MSKVTTYDNYRVVLDVDGRMLFGSDEQRHKTLLGKAQDIESSVKRHIDGVDSTEIICDTTNICSYCGMDWEVCTEPDDDWVIGQPVCCNEAADEFEKLRTCNE